MISSYELRHQIRNLANEPIQSYRYLLTQLAQYYLEILPSDLDQAVVLETEYALNQIYRDLDSQRQVAELEEVVLDALSKASLLSHRIKHMDGHDSEFFKTAKVLGRTIRVLVEVIDFY